MSPLVLLAIGFASGIALREALGLPWWSCALGCVAACALLLALWRRRRFLGLPSVAAAAWLGALSASGAHPVPPDGLLDGQPWHITARVLESPERTLGRAHVLVELERVGRAGRERQAHGRVRIALPGDPVEPLLPGDHVRLHARLLAPHGFHEPDSPDPEVRFAERGVIATAGVGSPASLARLVDGALQQSTPPSLHERIVARLGSPWVRLATAIAALRLRLLGRVATHLAGERRALVESLVLGDRAGISAELDDTFRRAGVTHVLSVSGLHLAIAGFLAFVVLRRALLRFTWLARRFAVRRIAAVAAMPATGLYTLLTGAAVATVRSCLASWLVLAGIAAARPATAEVALAVAALGLLAASPLVLYDPSFQLSFAAALGTVLVGGPLARRLLDALAPQLEGRFGGRLDGEVPLARLLRAVVRLVAASAAAIAATAPITAYHFGQVAPAGLVANLVVVPLAELWVLPVGLVACVVSAWTRLAALLFPVAGLGAAAMASSARLFAAHAPDGRLPAPSLVETLLFYAALGAFALWLRSPRRTVLRILGALLLALALVTTLRACDARLRPALRVTFLDVGQGDSCLVELPDGRRLLIDGGGSFDERFDPGAQVLLPWLRRQGITRLDVVVLTHLHPDHANGLPALVEALPVGEVWTNGARSNLPALARLEEAARARGVPVVRPHALQGPATVEVLHPLVDGQVRVVPAWSENDGSIVLRIAYAGRAVLLGGDIERRAEARLIDSGASLHADVLKAGHHCSKTSSTARFLDAVKPSVVVCSVGAANRWNFPSPEVVARLKGRDVDIRRTDRDGAVTVRIDGGGGIDLTNARRH